MNRNTHKVFLQTYTSRWCNEYDFNELLGLYIKRKMINLHLLFLFKFETFILCIPIKLTKSTCKLVTAFIFGRYAIQKRHDRLDLNCVEITHTHRPTPSVSMLTILIT